MAVSHPAGGDAPLARAATPHDPRFMRDFSRRLAAALALRAAVRPHQPRHAPPGCPIRPRRRRAIPILQPPHDQIAADPRARARAGGRAAAARPPVAARAAARRPSGRHRSLDAGAEGRRPRRARTPRPVRRVVLFDGTLARRVGEHERRQPARWTVAGRRAHGEQGGRRHRDAATLRQLPDPPRVAHPAGYHGVGPGARQQRLFLASTPGDAATSCRSSIRTATPPT